MPIISTNHSKIHKCCDGCCSCNVMSAHFTIDLSRPRLLNEYVSMLQTQIATRGWCVSLGCHGNQSVNNTM